MEPRIRRGIEDQIERMKYLIAHAHLYREHPNDPNIRPQIDRIMREESVSESVAIEVLVQGYSKLASERVEQLEAMLRQSPQIVP